MRSSNHFTSVFRRHFERHEEDSVGLEEERENCHWCQLKSFSIHNRYPVAIINTVDDSTLPDKFRFIESSVLGQDVEPAEEAFRAGCECIDDKECQRRGCHCLQDMAVDHVPDKGEKIIVYHTMGDRKECLRGAVVESRTPIYECHGSCLCSSNCSNRVVERGRKIPLQIFRTSDGRGWGVRSPIEIEKGRFIDRYVGEIITSSEADRRREASTIAQRKDVYLFALDKFSDPNSMDPRLSGPPFEVDGEFLSGPTRFINHSCDPNLRIFARVGDHADKHIHDLALFAIEDIPANEELTFDYVDGVVTDLRQDSNDPNKKKDMTKCLCGSENCRGYLW